MKKHPKGYAHALVRKIMLVYSIFLMLIGLLASYMAYDKESVALEAELNQAMKELSFAYESSTEYFWRSYVPIVQLSSDVYTAFSDYFESPTGEELTQLELTKLSGAIRELMSYNHGVQWIGLYTDKREVNYYKFSDNSNIAKIPEDFPFLEDIKEKSAFMEVFGSEELEHDGKEERTFVLCGNASIKTNEGVILFGYKKDLTYSYGDGIPGLESVKCYVANENGLLYDSSGSYDESILSLVQGDAEVVEQNGEALQVYRLKNGSNDYQVFCTIPKWLEQVEGHTYSPYILTVVVLFWLCSLLIYRWTSRGILRKIQNIQVGLHTIGDSNLKYRIPVSDPPKDEFEDIGRAINEMTAQLQENINRTYEMRVQQRSFPNCRRNSTPISCITLWRSSGARCMKTEIWKPPMSSPKWQNCSEICSVPRILSPSGMKSISAAPTCP